MAQATDQVMAQAMDRDSVQVTEQDSVPALAQVTARDSQEVAEVAMAALREEPMLIISMRMKPLKSD